MKLIKSDSKRFVMFPKIFKDFFCFVFMVSIKQRIIMISIESWDTEE